MKSALSAVKRYLRYGIIYIGDISYDVISYIVYSDLFDRGGKNRHALTKLVMDAHRLEKSCAMPNPEIGRGVKVAKRIERQLGKAKKNELNKSYEYEYARSSSEYYKKFQSQLIDKGRALDLRPVKMQFGAALGRDSAGTQLLNPEKSWSLSDCDLDNLFYLRSSVRNYSIEQVEPSLVRRVIELALTTPSVCNRQPWRIRHYTSRQKIDCALSYQNGNAGFTESVNNLFLISVDRACFNRPMERNQGFIDGGMFSMSIVTALHASGLASCCLNWSVDWWTDLKFKRAMRVPASELIIMMIAFGYSADRTRVALSPRRQLDDILEG